MLPVPINIDRYLAYTDRYLPASATEPKADQTNGPTDKSADRTNGLIEPTAPSNRRTYRTNACTNLSGVHTYPAAYLPNRQIYWPNRWAYRTYGSIGPSTQVTYQTNGSTESTDLPTHLPYLPSRRGYRTNMSTYASIYRPNQQAYEQTGPSNLTEGRPTNRTELTWYCLSLIMRLSAASQS